MAKLGETWMAFLRVLFDPWNLLLLSATGGFLWWSRSPNLDPSTGAVLTVLIIISSAVFGGRAARLWFEVTEEKTIVARGRSAIRSLKVLNSSIVGLNKRVDKFIAYQNKKSKAKLDPVTVTNLEEIREKGNDLLEDVINAVENWQDVIPEADVTTQIGAITELQAALETALGERDALTTEVEAAKEETARREDLESQLRRKDAEVLRLEKQLADKERALHRGLLSGLFDAPTKSAALVSFGTGIVEPPIQPSSAEARR